MATFLYRIGRFAYRRAWYVIATWVLALGAVLGAGLALGGQFQESFTIPGTESQQTIDQLDRVFPQVAGASAQVVYQAPKGSTVDDPAVKQAIQDMATTMGDLDQVAAVVDPYSEYATNAISEDRTIAYTQVQFDGPATDVTTQTLDELQAEAAPVEADGVRVEFGGSVFQEVSFGLTWTEAVGVLFAGVVLFVTFGSLLAAGMPLLSAILGVGLSSGAIMVTAAFTTVSSTAPMLAVMIGLAVGIDYALFILSRHRSQLAQGLDPEESAAQAVATAGGAVVFAGVTVIIALLGLLVVGIPFLSVMGVGAAFAVLVAVSIAVTLIPAIMGVARGRLVPKAGSRAQRRALAAAEHEGEGTARPSLGGRWVRIVMKAPIVFIVAIIGLLGVASIPALSLDLNLPTAASQPEDDTARQAYDLIAQGFGPGYNGAIVVAADITQTTDIQDDLAGIRSDLEAVDGVAYVGQGLPDQGLDTAIFRVVPTTAPDDPATKELVQHLRDLKGEIEDQYGTPITVSGQTAVAIDVSTQLTNALLPFGVLVVGLSIVLLAMVFRSLAVPIKAALGFALSVCVSFGVTVAVFQWGWLADLLHVTSTGPIISFLPILLMAILFGLAMDYEVFLVSGMREEFVKSGDARRAVRVGFQHGARVVTAAALIMFFVFFAFVPEGDGAIKMIALALAVGVFVDAFLVRMTLVPAVMTLLGRRAWSLPRWLDRLLPNVDVEGEGLRAHIEAKAWADARRGDVLTAEGLRVDGVPATVTASAPEGAIVLLAGDPGARRLVAGALAGRVAPAGGHLQVLGHPLPSARTRVERLSALVDLDGGPAGSGPVSDAETVGEAILERMRWGRSALRRVPREEVEDLVRRFDDALATASASDGRVSIHTPLSALSATGLALLRIALAGAQGARLVVADPGDAPLAVGSEAFLSAVAAVVGSDVTVVIGVPVPAASATSAESDLDGRALVRIDLGGSPAVTPSAGFAGGTRSLDPARLEGAHR
ncbi:hypothetical protein GCM10010988_14920 [Cnuibacter physcomitrellae]|uniref:Transporter n=1 Tax=Cnuibacter physcomitrellae TaxID=1619308 RepID=A0A1X9LM59_9MICO|nr:MMPL family transporter [Cnuibacter physcomitrellae]ARJ06273.1 transporter [Cnuibacter physcomitrellae]GGI37628.1 hypothetical protein GCM10010988_14920 [Cnuibacter physcomitrellae]